MQLVQNLKTERQKIWNLKAYTVSASSCLASVSLKSSVSMGHLKCRISKRLSGLGFSLLQRQTLYLNQATLVGCSSFVSLHLVFAGCHANLCTRSSFVNMCMYLCRLLPFYSQYKFFFLSLQTHTLAILSLFGPSTGIIIALPTLNSNLNLNHGY